MKTIVKRELMIYGGGFSIASVVCVIVVSLFANFPVRYALMPLIIIPLFIGGILAGATGSGPGVAAEGSVSGESGGDNAGEWRGDFIPGDSTEGVVPPIRSRSLIFCLFGVALWSLVALTIILLLD